VPAFVWLSEGMKTRHGFDPAQIPDDKTFGLGIIFHTVMGAFDLQSPIYQADQDILALP
jgi:glucan phosphoethanolaminetransferase (alkaline phosphatase superfamily)